MRLTDKLDDSITIDGKEYALDMSFDNILRFYELVADEEINEHIKLDYMFNMLVFDSEELDIDPHFKKEVIEQIMLIHVAQEKTQNEIDEEDQDDSSEGQDEETKVKEYDLTLDAGLIYASFVYDYKIDLFEEQGKLHWRKFQALLNGLSEESPFMKVINIRTSEVPAPNKYNAKDITKIRKLKRRYALDKPSEKNMQDGLSRAASFLRSKVKEKVVDIKK